MLENMIRAMLEDCETVEELNDAVNELTTYIDMLADSIVDEKEWYD